MSSHTRKLTETIRAIESLKMALRSTASESEYQRGLYNGVEMMRSLLCQDKPNIFDKEEKQASFYEEKYGKESYQFKPCGKEMDT